MSALKQELLDILENQASGKPLLLPKLTKKVTRTRHASRIRLALEDLEKSGKVVCLVNGYRVAETGGGCEGAG